MPQLHLALVDLARLAEVVDNFLVKHVELAHLFVYLRQVLDIGSRILNHGGSKRSLLPERVITLRHQRRNFLFPVVQIRPLQVLFEQVVEADVDMAVVSTILLEEVHNQAVRYLGVEHKVADEVELANEGRGILAKIVKHFHDFIRFKHLAETVLERVHALQVDDEALLRVVTLNELHAVTLGEAFAIHA